MNDILCRQLALDYCCTPEDVRDGKNHFTEHRFLEGRRRFREGKDCFLKVAMVGGKLLFTGRPEIVARCRETYAGEDAAWFLEAGSLRRLDALLRDFGCRVGTAHPFFLPGRAPWLPAPDCGLRWFRGAEIERVRGDRRLDEAFCFCEDAPDVLGLAALRDGEIVGMAGASADSPTMWQIGINVEPEVRGRGLGTALTALLKDEILRQGILPFYGTAASHLASQRTALAAGFLPAWAELAAEAAED